MSNRWLIWTLAPLVIVGFGTPVWGQLSGSSRTTSGMFGSRTMGGNVSAGNRTFASGGSGLGSGFGSGLGSGIGGSAFGGSSGGGDLLGGNERFVRGNRQSGQFVGSDAQDVSSLLQGLGNQANQGQGNVSRSGLTAQSGNRNNQANQANRGSSRGRNARGASAEDIRVSISTAFPAPTPTAPQLSTSLTTRFEKMEQIGKLSPIQVECEGGTAILQGVVRTEHDRELLEQLTLLEPGVRSVRNELTVGSLPGPAPSLLPNQPE